MKGGHSLKIETANGVVEAKLKAPLASIEDEFQTDVLAYCG